MLRFFFDAGVRTYKEYSGFVRGRFAALFNESGSTGDVDKEQTVAQYIFGIESESNVAADLLANESVIEREKLMRAPIIDYYTRMESISLIRKKQQDGGKDR